MKIIKYGDVNTVMRNPFGLHNYFGWPTAARLQNGRIAVVASGFRLRHVCPFGKTVLAYSEDEGQTYSLPAPVIDTPLDDRDGGILPFGKSSVIVTSFNNKVEFQRGFPGAYAHAYLDQITPAEEQKYLGSTFRISHDYGITFGELFKSPVTSPHGPTALPDGRLLWVGRTFSPLNSAKKEDECIKAYWMTPEGKMELAGQIDNIKINAEPTLSCEPHAIVLDDGTILAHIRVQQLTDDCTQKIFTIFQSESKDLGKTWTKPVQILDRLGGAPAHLFKHTSGMLICTYGYREKPYGIKAMFSRDNGKTWDTNNDIYVNHISSDLGYPSTVELSDGSLLTVFYAQKSEAAPCTILQQKWGFEND